jgi:hypothetical protein
MVHSSASSSRSRFTPFLHRIFTTRQAFAKGSLRSAAGYRLSTLRGKAGFVSARLVFLVSLVGATLPVCRVDAAHPPLRVDDPDFKGQLTAPLRTLVTTPRPVSLRTSFRRAGLDAPVLGLPESAHVAAGDSWSLGSALTFKEIPRAHRKHTSPPATGPPAYRPSCTTSGPPAITSAVTPGHDLHGPPADNTSPLKVPDPFPVDDLERHQKGRG